MRVEKRKEKNPGHANPTTPTSTAVATPVPRVIMRMETSRGPVNLSSLNVAQMARVTAGVSTYTHVLVRSRVWWQQPLGRHHSVKDSSHFHLQSHHTFRIWIKATDRERYATLPKYNAPALLSTMGSRRVARKRGVGAGPSLTNPSFEEVHPGWWHNGYMKGHILS